ncbi:hypothetical protein FOA52_006571 [Chlamydomonas sp. UWO 241]|nr:hypothetical protein FOA52_006571 [Chlamydomonas sp. UWO 241]
MPLTRAQKAAAAAKDQAWTESLQGFPIQDLPPELILDILVRAGAWPEDEGQPLGQEDRDEAHKGMLAYSALRAVDNGHASIASLLAEYEEKLGGGADGGDGDGADGDDGGDNDGEGA